MSAPSGSHAPDATQAWLAAFVARAGGVAGTVHRLENEVLVIAAAVNIPPKVVDLTRVIPRGKGMAGLAWERDEPVQTCNLKTDASGDVRPGAKAVNAKGAVALPIKNTQGSFRAVVGVAFADERVLDEATVDALAKDASTLPDA
jgi:L-methionine (R)-S-oxide reductase